MHARIHTHKYMHIYIPRRCATCSSQIVYTHTCMHTYVHTHKYTRIYIYIHTYIPRRCATCSSRIVYTHTCMHTYVHTHKYTRIYIYIYTYIHTKTMCHMLISQHTRIVGNKHLLNGYGGHLYVCMYVCVYT